MFCTSSMVLCGFSRVNRRMFSNTTQHRNRDSKSDPVRLTFLRHGQSTWNQQNIFIGMTDTPLTFEGRQEALSAGKMLSTRGIEFDAVHTSLLKRSTNTVNLVLQEMDLEWLPIIKDWRLNERNYGALVGANKKQCVEEFGKEQVKRWRRSWDEPPPPMSKSSPYYPYRDRRYEILGIKESEIPLCESLKDVTKRTSAFWDEVIVPQLKNKKRLLIVGHENNLRSLIKRLDGVSNEDIIHVELPRAIPLVYHLDPVTLKPLPVSGSADYLNGRYLCTPEELKNIAERDFKQVYDVNSQFGKGLGPANVGPNGTVDFTAVHGVHPIEVQHLQHLQQKQNAAVVQATPL